MSAVSIEEDELFLSSLSKENESSFLYTNPKEPNNSMNNQNYINTSKRSTRSNNDAGVPNISNIRQINSNTDNSYIGKDVGGINSNPGTTEKSWGKEVTIISQDPKGSISRQRYIWPKRKKPTIETNNNEGVNVCQQQLYNLESQNVELHKHLQKLQESYESTQRDLQVCRNVNYDTDNNEEIIPYFYNYNYESVGSQTLISRNNWKIKVWLIGRAPSRDDELILHPLGNSRRNRLNILPIQEIVFDLKIEDTTQVKDSSDSHTKIVGKAYGKTMMFKGKPIIKFSKFKNVSDETVDISYFSLPLLFESY